MRVDGEIGRERRVPGSVQLLDAGDLNSIRVLLERSLESNLFLLGLLSRDAFQFIEWYGVVGEEGLRGIVMLIADQLVVPWLPAAEDCALAGSFLRTSRLPCMVIGPRAMSDLLLAVWAPDLVPDRSYDQRLYVLASPPAGTALDDLRLARFSDAEQIMANAGRMENEDLGRELYSDRTIREIVVRERIRNRQTWVVEREGEIVFQMTVGTACEHGCHVEGTYVPPAFRGQGIATGALRALGRRLLDYYPRVTLTVNESNLPAVAAYERSGFQRSEPFRLVML